MASAAIQATYLRQGTDKKGNKTKGEIQGSNQASLKAQLRKQDTVDRFTTLMIPIYLPIFQLSAIM